MLNEDTKDDIKEIQDGVSKTLEAEKSKISKDTFKSPVVLTMLVFIVIVIGRSPGMGLFILFIFSLILLFSSVPAKTVGKVAVKIPRDMIQNRQKIKEEVIRKANQLQEHVKAKKDDPPEPKG